MVPPRRLEVSGAKLSASSLLRAKRGEMTRSMKSEEEQMLAAALRDLCKSGRGGSNTTYTFSLITSLTRKPESKLTVTSLLGISDRWSNKDIAVFLRRKLDAFTDSSAQPYQPEALFAALFSQTPNGADLEHPELEKRRSEVMGSFSGTTWKRLEVRAFDGFAKFLLASPHQGPWERIPPLQANVGHLEIITTYMTATAGLPQPPGAPTDLESIGYLYPDQQALVPLAQQLARQEEGIRRIQEERGSPALLEPTQIFHMEGNASRPGSSAPYKTWDLIEQLEEGLTLAVVALAVVLDQEPSWQRLRNIDPLSADAHAISHWLATAVAMLQDQPDAVPATKDSETSRYSEDHPGSEQDSDANDASQQTPGRQELVPAHSRVSDASSSSQGEQGHQPKKRPENRILILIYGVLLVSVFILSLLGFVSSQRIVTAGPDGTVAVYRGLLLGGYEIRLAAEPDRSTDILVTSLPEGTQWLLDRGLAAKSDADADTIISQLRRSQN